MRANITQGGSRKSGPPTIYCETEEPAISSSVESEMMEQPRREANTRPSCRVDGGNRAVFFAEWGLGQNRGNLKNTSLFRVLTFSAIFGIITDGTRGHDLRNNSIRQLRA